MVPINKNRRGRTRFGAENIASDTTCGIGGIRMHIFYPQTTQELPKKHHEAGPSEQLPTDALSQIDYGHTRHCEDCKEVWGGGGYVCTWLSER